jgi:hypothetical protein
MVKSVQREEGEEERERRIKEKAVKEEVMQR